MSLRFTQTDKWNDPWFSELSLEGKLLFIYLTENCDIAGFYEINYKTLISDLGLSKEKVEGAFKEVVRGIEGAYDKSGWIWVKKFLFHQKNLPLNPSNKAHIAILRSFEKHIPIHFTYKQIGIIPEGGLKGVGTPTGTGIGKGNTGGVGEIPKPGTPIDKITEQQFLAIKKIPVPNRTTEQTEIMRELSRTKYFHLC